MTKRLLSVAVAVLMVLALVPMSALAKTVGFKSDMDAQYAVTYSITAPEEIESPSVGDKFYMYLYVSANSGLEAGQFMVEYNYDYLDAIGYNSSAAGSVGRLSSTGYNNGTTDKFTVYVPDGSSIPYDYEGGTGANPHGEAGKH